jgi:acyl carrier protein phosphodiesterase
MNYLAHAYLSFNDSDILLGNMISDFVKGKKQYDFSSEILKGIKLHRAIDAFTDDHPATKKAKQYFKPSVGAYSGAFVDVAYDHFLANDNNCFTAATLKSFAEKTYDILEGYQALMPERFAFMFPYMKSQNWFVHYRSMQGTRQSFGGVVRRAVYLNNSDGAFSAFEQNYLALQKCYSEFFPELKQFAAQHLLTLNQS